jgi:hypothetical protein
MSGALLILGSTASAQNGPSMTVRERALRALVYVTAAGCPGGAQRAGSGFVLDAPSHVVTAHHVVGGCSSIDVTYESVPGGVPKTYSANVRRVYSRGDIAILSVTGAPSVIVLKRATPPPDRTSAFAALGYQNGQLSAGDLRVTFSVGDQRLRSILTADILTQLGKIQSPIDVSREVLRFNIALQPGMSGGPIIDAKGDVIGIVAGGLKAGAAPASWGWPSEWIAIADVSTESVARPIRIAGAYYTREELDAEAATATTAARITCGTLELMFRGTRSFRDIRPGSDDIQRLDYLVQLSTMSPAEIDALRFDVWVHEASGATAVTPAGYNLSNEDGVCVVRSTAGPFTQVVWASLALNQAAVQGVSTVFEQTVMAPRVPNFPFLIDPALTTFTQPNVPGPQLRDNGMVFNRKGFIHSLVMSPGPGSPSAHSFETLIAKAGTFLGVGTINRQRHPQMDVCAQNGWPPVPQCADARTHLLEWTRFILATQLSTYPAY